MANILDIPLAMLFNQSVQKPKRPRKSMKVAERWRKMQKEVERRNIY